MNRDRRTPLILLVVLALAGSCSVLARSGEPRSIAVEGRLAGSPAPAPLAREERDAIVLAEAPALELGTLRGGDLHLTDRDLKIILFTAGAILLALLLF